VVKSDYSRRSILIFSRAPFLLDGIIVINQIIGGTYGIKNIQ
jgi:hypothetical protein